MTFEEARDLKSYSQYCNCGGYSRTTNGKPGPHQTWCAQYKEFTEQQEALERGPTKETK